MAPGHSNNHRLFADDVWKTRIQLLWVVLSILYSFAAGQQGLLGRSAGETSTILLIFSGFIVSAMFVHILNREDQRAPRDLLLWGFTASTVCATSAYKLGDFTGTVLTSVYALLLAVFSWSSAESRTTYIVGLLLRCVLCAAVAGLLGMGFTGLIYSQGWERQPFVTIFPVSSAAFSGFLFALLTNPRPDLLFGYSVSKQRLLTTVCTAFLAFSGYMLLPEQLHRAWGLATTPRPLVGGLIGASLAILIPLPLAVSVRVWHWSTTWVGRARQLVLISAFGGMAHGAVVSIAHSFWSTRYTKLIYFILLELLAAILTAIGIVVALIVNEMVLQKARKS
jgi:hypothetical protein